MMDLSAAVDTQSTQTDEAKKERPVENIGQWQTRGHEHGHELDWGVYVLVLESEGRV